MLGTKGKKAKKSGENKKVQDEDIDKMALHKAMQNAASRRHFFSQARANLEETKNLEMLRTTTEVTRHGRVKRKSAVDSGVEKVNSMKAVSKSIAQTIRKWHLKSNAVITVKAGRDPSLGKPDLEKIADLLENLEEAAFLCAKDKKGDIQENMNLMRNQLANLIDMVHSSMAPDVEVNEILVRLTDLHEESDRLIALGTIDEADSQLAKALQEMAIRVPDLTARVRYNSSTKFQKARQKMKISTSMGKSWTKMENIIAEGSGYGGREDKEKKFKISKQNVRDALQNSNKWARVVGNDQTVLPITGRAIKPGQVVETWLRHFPGLDASGHEQQQAAKFWRNLPPERMTLEEVDLKRAIFRCVYQRGIKDYPQLADLARDPDVMRCMSAALPSLVSLEDWIERRASIGATVAHPPIYDETAATNAPPSANTASRPYTAQLGGPLSVSNVPLASAGTRLNIEEDDFWLPEYATRIVANWKNQLICVPAGVASSFPPSTSDVSGTNGLSRSPRRGKKSVPEAPATRSAVSASVPEACSVHHPSVVPQEDSQIPEPPRGPPRLAESKHYKWIDDSNNHRYMAGSAKRYGLFTLEETLVWRQLHRRRERVVQPSMCEMWGIYEKTAQPEARRCDCEWCSGHLNYQIPPRSHKETYGLKAATDLP